MQPFGHPKVTVSLNVFSEPRCMWWLVVAALVLPLRWLLLLSVATAPPPFPLCPPAPLVAHVTALLLGFCHLTRSDY